jgi:hypothetical protein
VGKGGVRMNTIFHYTAPQKGRKRIKALHDDSWNGYDLTQRKKRKRPRLIKKENEHSLILFGEEGE